MDGTSWADQWSSDPVSTPAEKNKKSNGFKQKVEENLDKTKAVASTGAKKVKDGATLGIQWIKDKYQKSTQKH